MPLPQYPYPPALRQVRQYFEVQDPNKDWLFRERPSREADTLLPPTYGTLWPIYKREGQTGLNALMHGQFAMPEILNQLPRGLAYAGRGYTDLAASPYTGNLTEEAFNTLAFGQLGPTGAGRSTLRVGGAPGAGLVDDFADDAGRMMKRDTGVGLTDDMNRQVDPTRRYTGKAPDRSSRTYLRYMPEKTSARAQRAIDALSDPNSPARKRFNQYVQQGREAGGMDWYNTERLRDDLIAAHGPVEGHRQWAEIMDLTGTTSAQSNVMDNIRSMSAARNRIYHDPEYVKQAMKVKGVKDVGPMVKSRPPGYGHMAARGQELATARYLQGDWDAMPEPWMATKPGSPDASWNIQPKPKGFSNSLKGGTQNMAQDVHWTRMIGMATRDPEWLNNQADVKASFAKFIREKHPEAAKYLGKREFKAGGKMKVMDTFNPKKAVADGLIDMEDIADYPKMWAEMPNNNEYGPLEVMANKIAAEMGDMTAPQMQANAWVGAGAQTGVKSKGTFMDSMMARAAIRAKKEGITPEQAYDNFIRNQDLLARTGGGAGAMVPGMLSQPSQPTRNAEDLTADELWQILGDRT